MINISFNKSNLTVLYFNKSQYSLRLKFKKKLSTFNKFYFNTCYKVDNNIEYSVNSYMYWHLGTTHFMAVFRVVVKWRENAHSKINYPRSSNFDVLWSLSLYRVALNGVLYCIHMFAFFYANSLSLQRFIIHAMN